MFSNTNIAHTTVFAPCWFEEIAGTTYLSGSEQNVIVRVKTHLLVMILLCDGGRSGCDGPVCEKDGRQAKAYGSDLVTG